MSAGEELPAPEHIVEKGISSALLARRAFAAAHFAAAIAELLFL